MFNRGVLKEQCKFGYQQKVFSFKEWRNASYGLHRQIALLAEYDNELSGFFSPLLVVLNKEGTVFEGFKLPLASLLNMTRCFWVTLYCLVIFNKETKNTLRLDFIKLQVLCLLLDYDTDLRGFHYDPGHNQEGSLEELSFIGDHVDFGSSRLFEI